jgi:hypothetical protein
MEEYDNLNIKSETQDLQEDEKARLNEIYVELSNFWLIEEIKAKGI